MDEPGLKQQAQLEELAAWLDGELDQAAAARVAELVAADPHWRATCRQFQAVDAALALLPPAVPRQNLTARIVSAAQPRRLVLPLVGVAAPLAAAACLVLAVWLTWNRPAGPQTPDLVSAPERLINDVLKDVPVDDRPIVQNLPLFADMDDVKDYGQVRDVADAATLTALLKLSQQGT